MSVDYVSKIILNIPIKVKTQVTEEKLTKYDENTGQPYLKTIRKCVTSYLIGDTSFKDDFFKFIDENNLDYNDSKETLYKTIFSLDDLGYYVDFSISELEEAKRDLIELLEKKGIKIDEDEIGFELVHFLC